MEKTKIGAIALVAVLAIALVFALVANSNKLSTEEADVLVADAETVLQANIDSLGNELITLEADNTALESDLTEKETKITELEAELAAPVEVPEIIIEDPSYLIDDVELDGNFKGTVDNDDLETLFFGEIDYDGDDYDAEEVLTFKNGFKPVLNVDDFGADIAIEIGTESFKYELIFDSAIEMVEDEDLILNFLGRDLTIVSSDDNEITYRTSQKVKLALNEEFTYQNSLIKVVGFDDGDVNSVLLLVDDELVSLEEGDTDRVNDIKINVKDIFLSSIGDYNSVIFYVGEDIVETVNDKEEFEDDDRFDWIIKSDSEGITKIGVKLIEELTEEDEVMALGDYLSLPYDYMTVTFDSLKELNVVELTASVRTDEIRIEFDGKIEIDGKKIDDSKFTFDGATVEYEYKGDDMTTTDLSEIVIFVEDRELGFDSDADSFSIGTYEFGYEFGVKEITSAPEGNEDEDYRFVYGDILYASDANNDDDEETSVTLGLVNDEDKEVVLKVQWKLN